MVVVAVVVVVAKIAIMAAIPFVVVLHAAATAFPIAREKLLTIVMRADPPGPFVRRTRPVTFVPAIAAIYRVLITVYPNVTGTGSRGPNGHNPGRRRRSDADADANLSAETKGACQQNEWK